MNGKFNGGGSGAAPTTLARQRLARALSVVEQWLRRRSVLLIGVLAALVALTKGGFNGLQWQVWSLASWPQPVEMYPYLSYGVRTVAWVLRIESIQGYVVLSWLAIAVCVVLIAWMLRQAVDGDVSRWVAMLLLAGPVMWIVFGRVLHSDVLVVTAGIMLGALGRKVPVAVVAALLALAGNPEQAVVMSVCLGVVSVAQPFRQWRRGAAVAIVVSMAGWLLLTVWSHDVGVPTRADGFSANLRLSLELFFMQFPLQIYAGFGISVIVVIWALADQRWRDAMIVAIGVIGVPLAMTAVTTDQTRVLVATSTAALTAILVLYSTSLYETLEASVRYPLALTAGALVLLPAIELTGNFVRVPWHELFPWVQYYLVGRMPFG